MTRDRGVNMRVGRHRWWVRWWRDGEGDFKTWRVSVTHCWRNRG